MFSLSCGRPSNTRILEEEYLVEKIIWRRVSRQRTDYLVMWKGYDATGETFEPPEHLPAALVKACDAYFDAMPPSTTVVVRVLRGLIARRLLDSSGPMFGIKVDVEKASLPEYADALLSLFAESPRGARGKLSSPRHATQRVRQLEITDQEHAAWIVGLHLARPEHGAGALRIKAGKASNCDMLMVACTETTPMLITHRAPKGATAARPLEGTYSFTVQFSTVAFSGYDGNFKPYTAPDNDLRLDNEQAEALVAYAKRTVKQPWAPKPIVHKLRGVWADLPAGRWRLLNP